MYDKCSQYHVFTYYDNDIKDLPKSIMKCSGSQLSSISTRYKGGKEGRFRGTLLGKRVNYSARTVITSDGMIECNSIGVPLEIAMKLSFPEVVTNDNREYLQKFINNGKTKYPGCNFIEFEDKYGKNHLFDVCGANLMELKNGMRVHRHLMTGDKILFNRQPSLHKLNMMCHSVQVITEPYYHDPMRTFRLNTSATEPYNADFDGDK